MLNTTKPFPMLRTAAEVSRDFKLRGISVAEWARARGYSAALVYLVLRGETIPTRGQTHRIAVELGIKEGILDSDLSFLRRNQEDNPGDEKNDMTKCK